MGRQTKCFCIKVNKIFNRENLKNILVPGSGYGYHTMFFYKEGFNVEGIEISDEAIRLAQTRNSNIVYFNESVLDKPFSDTKYDGIYCFNILHLFVDNDRNIFIKSCKDILVNNGTAYFKVFS